MDNFVFINITDAMLNAFIETIKFIIPLLILIFFSYLFAEILVELGILKKLEFLGRPLTKIANLPPESGTSFVASIGSFIAGNVILKNLYDNKKINRKELLLSSVLNSIIAPFKETFTYHIPVLLPTLGLFVGGIYLATVWAGTIMTILFVIIAGKSFLPKRDYKIENSDEKSSVMIALNFDKFKKIFPVAIKNTLSQFKKIASLFFVMSFIIFFLIEIGVFNMLNGLIAPLSNIVGIPSSAIPALLTYIASPLLGYASFGSLLQAHEITEIEAIIALLFGSIFMLPILYVKLYFPQFISIFGFRLGLIRGIITLSLVMITRGFILLIFLFVGKI